MKKTFFCFVFPLLFVSLVFASSVAVNENFETLSFEVFVEGKKKLDLPFSTFCGYRIYNDNCYFIDCSKSRIPEYGELCCFDSVSGKLRYLGIMSGSTFVIKNDLLIITTLSEVGKKSDVQDAFGLGLPDRQFPLNVAVYDLKTLKKLKDFNFEDEIKDCSKDSLFLTMKELPDDCIFLEYGILDTTRKIKIGKLDLKNLAIVEE